jgi:hypothetical protein
MRFSRNSAMTKRRNLPDPPVEYVRLRPPGTSMPRTIVPLNLPLSTILELARANKKGASQ